MGLNRILVIGLVQPDLAEFLGFFETFEEFVSAVGTLGKTLVMGFQSLACSRVVMVKGLGRTFSDTLEESSPTLMTIV